MIRKNLSWRLSKCLLRNNHKLRRTQTRRNLKKLDFLRNLLPKEKFNNIKAREIARLRPIYQNK
jgi:hypothetical protein